MNVIDSRLDRLERILKELLEIHALSPTTPPPTLRTWLDLAIVETRSQIEKMRTGTLH